LTGSSQDALVPFPMYKCESCGHINEEFQMPE
jgi:predicted nucleic acid-binding Zn ribbon protein